MSQRMSRLHRQLAPTLALLRFKCSLVPRKRGRESKTALPVSGEGIKNSFPRLWVRN